MAVFRITGKNNLNTRFSRLIALRNVPEQILKKLASKRRYKLQQARNEFKRWSEPLHSPTHEDQLLAKISSFQNLDIEVSNDDPRSLNGNRDSFRFAYGNCSYSSQRPPWLDMNKIM